jgi:hypothetical protein
VLRRSVESAHGLPLRSADPSYAGLDGLTASIEGWINFESGEVEVEAWAM